MKYQEFLDKHADIALTINPATLRSWKARDNVPDSTVAKSVASPVATEKSVATASPRVAKADDPYEIMADGFARGFPGDTQIMRKDYRTPAAIRRIVERKHGEVVSIEHVQAAIAKWNATGKIAA